MAKLARLGDTSSHGGVIISGSNTTKDGNKPVAKLGDLHACPIYGHGITPITGPCSPTTKVDNKKVARVGDMSACGAMITVGSSTTKIDGP